MANSPIARAEATQAQHQATIVDAHQPGAIVAVALPDGAVELVLEVVPPAGEVEVVVLLAGEVTAAAQRTAVVMEAGQPTVEQQHMAVLRPTEVQLRMVEVQPTAATMAIVLHTVASILVVAHLDGEALDLATQHRSQIFPPLHLELTMLPRQVHMPRQHREATVHTQHPHLVAQWTLPHLATTLRQHPELAMAKHQQVHLRQVHGTSRHQRRAARIRVTIESLPDCTIEVLARIRYHLT